MAFTVAIIGRPNVGKSTLFNRLVGLKLALVDDTPGVTRDRRRHTAQLQDLSFDVIDTAGLEKGKEQTLEGRMRAQTTLAIKESDLILFLFDAKSGILAQDLEFASLLRKSGKPIILVGNKAEARAAKENFHEAWQLGLGEPCFISAEHGLGLSDLRDAIFHSAEDKTIFDKTPKEHKSKSVSIFEGNLLSEDAQEDKDAYDDRQLLRLAIVGRPNVGKSTFINSLLGEDRVLTGPEAGITRDSIAVDWQWRGRPIKVSDTAGLRRKARVQGKLEKLSVGETLRSIRFAEVVVVMMDATMPFEKQDLQIVDLVIKEGRALVLAFNKWDLIDNPSEKLTELYEKAARLLPQVQNIRAVPISGVYGKNVDKLMENIEYVHRIWNRRISTGKLNRWLEEVLIYHPPPAVAGRRLKIKYITQIKTRPPSFVLSCSRKDDIPTSYLRYLVNSLRKSFEMPAVPIRLFLKTAENPYANKKKKRS